MKQQRKEKLLSEIDNLRKRIRDLFQQIKELNLRKSEIEKEINDVKSEYYKDIKEIPSDISLRLKRLVKEEKFINNKIFQSEKKLYGLVDSKRKGIFYQLPYKEILFRRLTIGNKKMTDELEEERINNALNLLEDKIAKRLREYAIEIKSEEEILDLTLTYLKHNTKASQENYDELSAEEVFEIAFKELLKERFNITETININKRQKNKASKTDDKEEEITAKVNEVIEIIKQMNKNSKGIKTTLQTHFEEIWDLYRIPEKDTALGFTKKDFAKKYFWVKGIKDFKRYKNFDTFYKSIFYK
ncbi:MAG: hypothetical protein KatS3mg002_1675 [Candidatus Woesearchaeota archaeon]|nr:MAG: hypothetical protein KatS3mg002_1675 [Candidatus Woesearchaeota archaeon]